MKRSAFAARMILAALILLLFFIYLAVHLYNVQIRRHEILYKKARRKYTTVEKFKGKRGEIFDINGHLLVGNEPCINIRANPQLVGDKDKCRALAGYFSRKLDASAQVIYRRLTTKKIHGRKMLQVVVKNNVPLFTARKIKKELKERGFKGISFYDSTKRYYPKNELLSNILGFINSSALKITPVCGIEQAYNSLLAPVKVQKSFYERTRTGIPLAYGNKDFKPAKPGKNIYLTINEPIQEIVEEELDKLVKKWEPKAAYAVMVNPKTGSIIAMAQRPSFNPNDRSGMKPEHWRNRIVADGFEPGSMMKPLVIVKALSIGLVKPDTKINCENGYWIYGKRPLRDTHPYGKIKVSSVIQKSSNIGTAKISLLIGKKRLYNLLRNYGFGQKTNLPFKHEATGILRSLKNWDTLSITRFPIGQGILVSPLQLIGAYTVLANEGRRMRLRIVDKIEDPKTGKVYKYPVRTADVVIKNRKYVKEVVEMMKLVTESGGTAKRAAVPGYEVAGKTGTSQKWVDGKYSHSKYFAGFIGFVPAEDPAFLLLVVADEPLKSIYGGVVTAPAFSAIARKTLKYFDIQPAEQSLSEKR
ncbi:MAG: penicillin-binding protein 2 [Victivallales bacterium]|nr:penicillin-binding protein 2 [Victivallales bacterium]MCF7888608.1 penicillin-binding protein 2 [Victivallales bacterium]